MATCEKCKGDNFDERYFCDDCYRLISHDELKRVAQEAFEAAREKVKHPDWDYIYDDFAEYWVK